MKLELIKEKEVPILSRKRYTYLTDADGTTPSRMDLMKEIAKQLKIDEKLVVIKHIYPQYGSKKVKLIVNVYKNEKDKKKFEHKSLVGKHEKKTKAQIEQEEKEKVDKEAEAQKKKEEADVAKQEMKEEAEHKKEEAAEEKPEEAPAEDKKEEKPAEEGK